MNIQDWFPLGLTGWISLQFRGLKRLLQHHSSEVSILWHSAFFIAQLSHPYMTTGKTIALTRRTFVGKVMSLPFNMLSFPKVEIRMTQEVVTVIYALCTWVSQISFLELMRGKDPHTWGEMAEAEPVGLSTRMAVSPCCWMCGCSVACALSLSEEQASALQLHWWERRGLGRGCGAHGTS